VHLAMRPLSFCIGRYEYSVTGSASLQGRRVERSGSGVYLIAMSMVIVKAGSLLGYVVDNWHIDWYAVILCGLPVAAYWRGHVRRMRQSMAPEIRAGYERRALAMVAANVLMAIGFFSPIPVWAMVYQWVHMIWHLDLMVFAPPFLIMADPWSEMADGVPAPLMRWMRAHYRSLATRERVAKVARVVSSPWAAVVAFDAAMWIWHIPAPFDWAMQSSGRMELMMFSFFFAGVFMWYVAIDQGKRRYHENGILRFAHIASVSMSCMILAILLGLSSGAWYSAFDWAMGTYRTMSLLADQQIASGILWVFGVIPWFLAGVVVLRDTLNDEEHGVNNFSDTFRSFILRRVRVATAARVPERQSATLDANSADS